MSAASVRDTLIAVVEALVPASQPRVRFRCIRKPRAAQPPPESGWPMRSFAIETRSGPSDAGIAGGTLTLFREEWAIGVAYPTGGPVATEDLDRLIREDGIQIIHALEMPAVWAGDVHNLGIGIQPVEIFEVSGEFGTGVESTIPLWVEYFA